MTGPADLAADPALGRLWLRARERIEAGGGRAATGSFTIRDPTPEERVAVGLLLGRKLRGRSLRIPLAELDDALRGSPGGESLLAFLERTGGPLCDRPAERRRQAEAEEQLWSTAADHPALVRHPKLAAWLDRLRRSGSLRGTPEERPTLLRSVLDVLRELPVAGVARPVLAADLFGDAHALDDVRPAGRLALAALAHLSGDPPPARAHDRLGLWERWGVVAEGATSRVLVLGLRPVGDSSVARALRGLAEAGLPVPVTLPMLAALEATGAPAAGPEAAVAFACENPTILEVIARRHGARSPLVISTEGMPSVAARRLFRMLADAGTEVRYHGDFGAGGIRIGNVVIGECGATPWRFCAADYRAALDSVRDTTPIRPPVPDATWDPALAPLLRTESREIHEEQLLRTLLADLPGPDAAPAAPEGG